MARLRTQSGSCAMLKSWSAGRLPKACSQNALPRAELLDRAISSGRRRCLSAQDPHHRRANDREQSCARTENRPAGFRVPGNPGHARSRAVRKDVVPLASDDDKRASVFASSLSKSTRLCPVIGAMPVLGGGNAKQFQKGRSEVDGADQLAHAATGMDDAGGPAHHERHAMRIVVGVPLHAREGHAVVGGDDHQRIGRFAAGVERRQQFADLRVESFDLDRVVEQVAAARCRCLASKRGRDRCRLASCLRPGPSRLRSFDADRRYRTSRKRAHRPGRALRNCANCSPGFPPRLAPGRPKSRLFPAASSAMPGPQTLPALPPYTPAFCKASPNVEEPGGKKL